MRVIVAGLTWIIKETLGPMPALMATAEYVTKVHAVCAKQVIWPITAIENQIKRTWFFG